MYNTFDAYVRLCAMMCIRIGWLAVGLDGPDKTSVYKWPKGRRKKLANVGKRKSAIESVLAAFSSAALRLLMHRAHMHTYARARIHESHCFFCMCMRFLSSRHRRRLCCCYSMACTVHHIFSKKNLSISRVCARANVEHRKFTSFITYAFRIILRNSNLWMNSKLECFWISFLGFIYSACPLIF